MSDKQSPLDIHEVNKEHGAAETIDHIAGKEAVQED